MVRIFRDAKETRPVVAMTGDARNLDSRSATMSDLVALVDRFDDAQPRKKAGRKPKAAVE